MLTLKLALKCHQLMERRQDQQTLLPGSIKAHIGRKLEAMVDSAGIGDVDGAPDFSINFKKRKKKNLKTPQKVLSPSARLLSAQLASKRPERPSQDWVSCCSQQSQEGIVA